MTRTGLADQLLKLAADFESTGLAPDLLNAIDRASKEVAAAPRPKGGISGLMGIYGLMKQPETQQAIHFAVATLCSLCQARVPKGESHQERDRERRQRIPLEGSQRQRVFIRLPHAMFMTAAGTQRSASEVIAKVTGTEADSRTLEAIPEIAVGRITPNEQALLLREGAQVFPDVQFKIFDDDLKPEPRARFWEAPALPAAATNVPTLTDVMQHVRADRAWKVTEGRGVTIAVVDSGIAPDLPELPAGAKRSSVDPGGVYSGSHWQDPVGHGSMCAAIAAGGGGAAAFRGVAPEATVLSARSDLSAIDVSTIYTGLILAKRQGRIPGPLVISNSWGLYTCGGFVTLPCREREVSAPQELSGRCDCSPPRCHRDTAKRAVRLGGDEMALDVEGVVDGGVG